MRRDKRVIKRAIPIVIFVLLVFSYATSRSVKFKVSHQERSKPNFSRTAPQVKPNELQHAIADALLLRNQDSVNPLLRLLPVIKSANFKSYTRFSESFEDFMAEAEHIFILTTKDCRFENFPLNWKNKTSCVNAGDFDAAFYAEGTYDGHHTRISNAHATFVRYAREMGWRSVAVMEGDSVSYSDLPRNADALLNFRMLLKSDKWSIIRFGYRPFFLESENAAVCPDVCKCMKSFEGYHMGGLGCIIVSQKCDIRSSDAYILHESAYDEFEENLAKYTIDMEPMRHLKNAWFSIPQLSFQTDSAQLIKRQVEISEEFVQRCVM